MTITHCDFCNELSGSAENAFDKIYKGNPEKRVLYRSNHLAVLPSIGQIVEAYLLVLPIEHFTALGDLPSPMLAELTSVWQRVGRTLQDEYGPYILFEHGARSEGSGGCGIDHAHLHAVPLAGTPDPVKRLKSKFPYTEFARLDEIINRSYGLSTYLFYRDSTARLYLFDTGPLPSQYMRKVLADSLGEQNWNWRTAGREERLLATIERLSGKFQIEGKAIPPPASKCQPTAKS